MSIMNANPAYLSTRWRVDWNLRIIWTGMAGICWCNCNKSSINNPFISWRRTRHYVHHRSRLDVKRDPDYAGILSPTFLWNLKVGQIKVMFVFFFVHSTCLRPVSPMRMMMIMIIINEGPKRCVFRSSRTSVGRPILIWDLKKSPLIQWPQATLECNSFVALGYTIWRKWAIFSMLKTKGAPLVSGFQPLGLTDWFWWIVRACFPVISCCSPEETEVSDLVGVIFTLEKQSWSCIYGSNRWGKEFVECKAWFLISNNALGPEPHRKRRGDWL